MRSAWLLASTLALGCAGAAPHPCSATDPARQALVEQLCAPLPHRAFDCTVAWPASVPPARRDAVATASGGQAWASVPGVRAFASCGDRAAEEGPVAHVITLLVDTSVGSAVAIAERLPVHVRWEEACAGEADDCATYYARTDGDLVVLTRRVQRPTATDEDVAQLACAAVADGAEEAHVRLDGYGALVRALGLDPSGVTITSRRPARGESERSHRTWTELDLGVLDDHLEHEADVRAAAMSRPMDPEDVDVASESVLDMQVQARRRQLARSASTEGYRALARLTERGFSAHPSRPDLAVLSITASIEARDLEQARGVLASLDATVGGDDDTVRELGVTLDVLAGDAASLAVRVSAMAPDLPTADTTAVATALVQQIAAHPLEHDASMPAMLRALIAAARAAHVALVHRTPVTLAPAHGAVWAIEALSAGRATSLLAMCSDAALPTAIGGRTTSRGGAMAFAALDHCAAIVAPSAMRFDAGASAAGLVSSARGATRMFVELDGTLVGLGGTLDAGGALHVDSASRALVHADLGRAQREVVLPLGALGTRVFPPPTMALSLAEPRRDAALAATRPIEGVECTRSTTGLSCRLESYESVERLAEAAYAAFAAQ